MDIESLISYTEQRYSMKLPREKVYQIAQMAVHKTIQKQEVISRMGDKDNQLYMLLSGIMRLYYIDLEGNDITRYFATEGSIFGGSGKVESYAMETLEDCEVLVVEEGTKVMEIIKADMSLLRLYTQMLEESIAYKIYRESSFLMESATERYIDFKKNYPGLEKRVNQMHIATYLGITPISLSRIRRTIKEEK